MWVPDDPEEPVAWPAAEVLPSDPDMPTWQVRLPGLGEVVVAEVFPAAQAEPADEVLVAARDDAGARSFVVRAEGPPVVVTDDEGRVAGTIRGR